MRALEELSKRVSAAMTPKGTVLVVDDDATIVELLETALEAQGYLVLASVGRDSLAVARTTQPDVILLDINMPGMDGVEVSQHLRDDPQTAAIPIVVMSAQARLQATARLMPVDDRLPKPFRIDQLYQTVARWVQR